MADILHTAQSKAFYWNELFCILIEIYLYVFAWGEINNKSTLV